MSWSKLSTTSMCRNIFTHISVTVTPGPRYYYVTGAINQTGRGKQLYTGKVTVLSAIGAAGGFNDFAARKRVQLTRQDGTIFIEDCMKALKNPKLGSGSSSGRQNFRGQGDH